MLFPFSMPQRSIYPMISGEPKSWMVPVVILSYLCFSVMEFTRAVAKSTTIHVLSIRCSHRYSRHPFSIKAAYQAPFIWHVTSAPYFEVCSIPICILLIRIRSDGSAVVFFLLSSFDFLGWPIELFHGSGLVSLNNLFHLPSHDSVAVIADDTILTDSCAGALDSAENFSPDVAQMLSHR